MKYVIGQKLYYVDAKVHLLTRQKIKTVDENGVEWYRYDKPRFTYQIVPYTILGGVKHEVFGQKPIYQDYEDSYFCRRDDADEDDDLDEVIEDEIFSQEYEAENPYHESWFDNLAAAEAFKAGQESKVKE